MTAADFAHPEWIGWSAAAFGLACLAVGASSWRAGRRMTLLLGRRDPDRRRRAAGDAALLLALAALLLGLVGPRWSTREVRVTASGSDLVLLFDTSRSMDAEDNPPSRLQRARRTASGVLDALAPGGRAALAAFADRGVLLTPLSPDTVALTELVGAIDTDLVTPGGSDLGAGLGAAVEAFEEASERPRVLLVLSDGEVRPPLDSRLVGRLESEGVRVLAVGLGRAHGHVVPDGGVPLRDVRGEIVVSRRMVSSLETLTEATGGRLWLADDWGDVDVGSLVAEIERDSRAAADSEDGFVWRRVRAPWIGPFAALAFALLALEVAWAGRPARGRAQRSGRASWPPWVRAAAGRRGRTVAAAVGIALLAPTFLGAGRPEDPISRIDRLEALARQRGLRGDELVELGVARFEVGRSDEAEHALRAAAIRALEVGRSDWAALAYHDLGVIALERGDREAARDHFFEAVALAPDASRSRYNLEWTLRSLAVPEAPPTPSPTGTTPDEDDPRRQPEPEADADGSEAEEDPGPAVETPRPDPPDDPSTEPQRAELTTEAGTQPTGSPADAPPPPRLDAEQAARWLERVDDDPSRALRSAAERDRSERRRRRSQQAW